MSWFWNRIAHRYEGWVAQVNWPQHQINITGGVSGRILEVCCGTGALTRNLMQRGLHAFAIDLSPRMIRQAAHQAPHPGRFAVADAAHLPFADAAFDYVICTGALGLFPLAFKRAVLRELARVTRGEIRLLEPLEAQPGFYWRRVLLFFMDGQRPLPRNLFAELGRIPAEEWSAILGLFTYVRLSPPGTGSAPHIFDQSRS